MKICHGSLAFLAFLEKNIKISVGIDISLQFKPYYHPACHTDVLFKEQEVYLPVSHCIWYCNGRLTQRTCTFITYVITVRVTPHRSELPFRKVGDHP